MTSVAVNRMLLEDTEIRGPETRASKSERTRQRLLDAAASVLAARGYAQTRLSDIVADVGLHPASIYYHFPSKDALVEAVLTNAVSTGRDVVSRSVAALPAPAAPLQQIVTAIHAHMRAVLEISDYVAAALRVVGEVPSEIRRAFAADQRHYMFYWDGLLKRAVEQGQIRRDADLRIVRVLLVNAMGGRIEWYTRHSSAGASKVADQIVRSFVAGLAQGRWRQRIVGRSVRDASLQAVEEGMASLRRESSKREH